jgi:hypothetical protein
MKKLQMLTSAAGVLLVLAGPALAANRTHRGTDAYASGEYSDRSGAYNYGPQRGAAGSSIATSGAQGWGNPAYSHGPQQNLPYPDRPYGDPDRW